VTKRDVAMSFLGGPYNPTLHVLTTLLIIEVEWGIAVFIGWFFSSLIVFYVVGLVATVVSIIGAFSSYLTQQTELERKEPPSMAGK
jgi:hypothetical protein